MALFLSVDIHQGDERFSVHSRGKQCAFMSLMAFLTAQNIVNIACCTNMLNDFSYESYYENARYVELERLFRQKQLHHTGDHMKR